MKDILVYGSLRKGHWNHDRFNLGDPLAFEVVHGYTIISLGAYPGAIPQKGAALLCERYSVDDQVYHHINLMEVGAGYKPVQIGDATLWEYRWPTEDDHPVPPGPDGITEWRRQGE